MAWLALVFSGMDNKIDLRKERHLGFRFKTVAIPSDETQKFYSTTRISSVQSLSANSYSRARFVRARSSFRCRSWRLSRMCQTPSLPTPLFSNSSTLRLCRHFQGNNERLGHTWSKWLFSFWMNCLDLWVKESSLFDPFFTFLLDSFQLWCTFFQGNDERLGVTRPRWLLRCWKDCYELWGKEALPLNFLLTLLLDSIQLRHNAWRVAFPRLFKVIGQWSEDMRFWAPGRIVAVDVVMVPLPHLVGAVLLSLTISMIDVTCNLRWEAIEGSCAYIRLCRDLLLWWKCSCRFINNEYQTHASAVFV